IEMVRKEVAGETPEGLQRAKMLMLGDRKSGKGMGITLFGSEEAMRRGDAALNAMDPGSTERRTSVEFYEVPVETISYACVAGWSRTRSCPTRGASSSH